MFHHLLWIFLQMKYAVNLQGNSLEPGNGNWGWCCLIQLRRHICSYIVNMPFENSFLAIHWVAHLYFSNKIGKQFVNFPGKVLDFLWWDGICQQNSLHWRCHGGICYVLAEIMRTMIIKKIDDNLFYATLLLIKNIDINCLVSQ